MRSTDGQWDHECTARASPPPPHTHPHPHTRCEKMSRSTSSAPGHMTWTGRCTAQHTTPRAQGSGHRDWLAANRNIQRTRQRRRHCPGHDPLFVVGLFVGKHRLDGAVGAERLGELRDRARRIAGADHLRDGKGGVTVGGTVGGQWYGGMAGRDGTGRTGDVGAGAGAVVKGIISWVADQAGGWVGGSVDWTTVGLVPGRSRGPVAGPGGLPQPRPASAAAAARTSGGRTSIWR